MDPVVLQPGDGETITERERRSVVIKGAHDLVDVTESRYVPGERGPDPHVHREHADAFYVLEGELAFTFRAEPAARQVVASAGTLVLVPAGVVHMFQNDGPADARFLNVHAPSRGFAESLRVRRDRRPYDPAAFDSFDPPADGGRDVGDVVVRPRDEGEVVVLGASRALLKAQGSDGDGTFSLGENTLAPGFPGPVPHVHESLVDSFYVLDGTLTVRLDAETTEAPAGSFAFVPPGNVHTFANETDEPVRVLNLMAPGGFEQYLKEVARVAAPGGPPDPALMAEIASRYDFRPA